MIPLVLNGNGPVNRRSNAVMSACMRMTLRFFCRRAAGIARSCAR